MKGIEQSIYVIMAIIVAVAIGAMYLFAIDRTQRTVAEPTELTDIFTICDRLGINVNDMEEEPVSELSVDYLSSISQTIRSYCKDLGNDLLSCASACKHAGEGECGKSSNLYIECNECIYSIGKWCIPSSEKKIYDETGTVVKIERTPLKYLLDVCRKIKEYRGICQKENRDIYECLRHYSYAWCDPYESS